MISKMSYSISLSFVWKKYFHIPKFREIILKSGLADIKEHSNNTKLSSRIVTNLCQKFWIEVRHYNKNNFPKHMELCTTMGQALTVVDHGGLTSQRNWQRIRKPISSGKPIWSFLTKVAKYCKTASHSPQVLIQLKFALKPTATLLVKILSSPRDPRCVK